LGLDIECTSCYNISTVVCISHQ